MQLSAVTSALGRFFAELQRRKVLRLAAAYVVGAWIVLQVALALQTAMSLSGQFSATMLALLVIGFFVAVVLTWFYEITPEGVKRTAPASGNAPFVKPQTTDLILVGALGLVVVVALVQLFASTSVSPSWTAPTTTATASKPELPALGDKSIAVLPFANLSTDKEGEVFADGLTEELLNLLAKIGDLKVISRTSSFAFKGKKAPLPEIAGKLGVRHVLEGSVRTEGDELRVKAQLVDVSTDTNLWSESYERKLEGIFALQDEIARDIAGALKLEVALSTIERAPPTKNIEAYRKFLKARSLYTRRDAGDLEESTNLYKQAVAQDPSFAEAHAGLATNYAAMADRSGGPYNDLSLLARQSAVLALKLNPSLARAYGAQARLARQALDWEAIFQNHSKAVALDPSDSVTLMTLANAQLMIGQFKTARRTRDSAFRLDPIYGSLGAILPVFDALAVRDDRRVEDLAKKFFQMPGESRGIGAFALCILARERGDHAEVERLLRLAGKDFAVPVSVTESLVRGAKSSSAFAEAARAIKAEVSRDPTADPAVLFFLIGDYDRFFDVLDARAAARNTARFWISMALAWRAESADRNANRRFRALVQKTGLVDYWRKHGWPDRCRAKGEDDFECS